LRLVLRSLLVRALLLCGLLVGGVLAVRAERLPLVAEDGGAAVVAVLVGHRRALQEEFAHALGAPAVVLAVLLAEFLAHGLLVEAVVRVAHGRTQGATPRKPCGGRPAPEIRRASNSR